MINIKGKSIHSTFIGNKLYQTCLEVINRLEQSKSDIEQTLDPNSGHLQIAVATTTNLFISYILARFKQQHPKMTFHLEVANRKFLFEN